MCLRLGSQQAQMGRGGMKVILLAGNIVLDNIANGAIISHCREDEEGNTVYGFEWQGGPFCRIDRHIWGQAGLVGERRLTTARIGPFDLLLIEDDPRLPYEVWYSAQPNPFIGGVAWEKAGGEL